MHHFTRNHLTARYSVAVPYKRNKLARVSPYATLTTTERRFANPVLNWLCATFL